MKIGGLRESSTPGQKETIGGIIDEFEAEKRHFEFVAKALQNVFSQIDRALTMMRVYPKNHPLVDNLIQQVVEKFDPIFEVEEDVIIRVNADELTSEWGHVVHSKSSSEKNTFVWYSSYADGIIQFEFHKGLGANELQRFLWLINRSTADEITSDDDTVTLLWELNLKKVKYFAVEGFVDGGSIEAFDKRTEPEALALVADAAENPSAPSELDEIFSNINTIHVDLFTRMQIESQLKLPHMELRDQDLEYAFLVNATNLKDVIDEWISSADLEYRLIEALLSVIRTAPASVGAEKAGEIIMAVTHQLIDREMWDDAVKVMKLLDARRSHFVDKGFDPLGIVLEELSDPTRLDALLNGFQKNALLRSELQELLLLLDHDKLQTQVILVIGNKDRNLIGLKWLFLLLKSATNRSNTKNIYAPAILKNPVYLQRMLSILVDEAHTHWQPASRLILAALEHKKKEIQLLALNIEDNIWKDPRIGEKYLTNFSNHVDEDLRKRALKLLREYHKELFKKAVKDNVLSKKFTEKSIGEIRFLMRMFIDICDDGPAKLRDMIKIRGWSSVHARNLAVIAAEVLMKRNDADAKKIIKSYRESRLTHTELRDSYAKILIKYQVDDV